MKTSMTDNDEKYLLVLLGPTGVGKTDMSIELATHFNAHIVSSDSRQFYREMTIGTAVPSAGQLAAAPHHFIQCRSVTEPYTAGKFETDALKCLEGLFKENPFVVLSGGSGLYIDALCRGIDAVPGTNAGLRGRLIPDYQVNGLEQLLEQLKTLDPVYYDEVDRNNPRRVIRALEVCLETGKPYSSFRTREKKARDFNLVKIGLTRPRSKLYDRINARVDAMMQAGLLGEARAVYPLKNLNALQTVGYKELFDYFDGKCALDTAVELIKRNSRRYAKRQMTWFGKDGSIRWFDLSTATAGDVISYVERQCRPIFSEDIFSR